MKQAMIFAAGLGTRLKPLTDSKPKALVEVAGRPLLDWVLGKLQHSGFTDVVVNVHHFPDQIITHLRHAASAVHLNIQISDERTKLLDTGGGLRKAIPLFQSQNSPILVHNVDILSNADLDLLYQKGKGHDALLLVSERKTARYLLFNDEMQLVGWTNIQTGEVRSPYPELKVNACRRFAFSGIHVISCSLQKQMQTWPDCFGIMDFYIQQCNQLDICGYVEPDLKLLDVGKLNALDEAADFADKYCL